jgi:hypothetical protein
MFQPVFPKAAWQKHSSGATNVQGSLMPKIALRHLHVADSWMAVRKYEANWPTAYLVSFAQPVMCPV